MVEAQNAVWKPFGRFRWSRTDPKTGKLVLHPDADPERQVVGNYSGYLLPVPGEETAFRHVPRYSFAVRAYFGSEWRSNWGDVRRYFRFIYRNKAFAGVYYKSTGIAIAREVISGPERRLLIPLQKLKAKYGNLAAAYLVGEPGAVRGVEGIQDRMKSYSEHLRKHSDWPEYRLLLRHVLRVAKKELE